MTVPSMSAKTRGGSIDLPTPQGNLAGLTLVRDHGEPIAPSAITEMFEAIDPRLTFRAFPFASGWEWAICEQWGEHDPRRQTIQRGETPPDRAFDIIGFVEKELTLTSAEDAAAYFVRALKSHAKSRPEWMAYLTKVDEYNVAQAKRNQQPVVDYAQELAEANASTLFKDQGKTMSRVFQSEPVNQRGAKRAQGKDAVIPKPSSG